jgi:hypothetical protein
MYYFLKAVVKPDVTKLKNMDFSQIEAARPADGANAKLLRSY